MKTQLPDYSQANVVVVGDVMLDRYWSGSTARISPEAPVPVVRIGDQHARPGGAANVAMNIAALNGHVNLIGMIGVDEAGKILQKQLKEQKVNSDLVKVPGHPTITKLRILSRHQQLIRLDFEEDFQLVDKKILLNQVKMALHQAKVLIISDYAKGALSGVPDMIKLAKKTKIPVLIDPKGTDFDCYRGATLITPNMVEFEAVVGPSATEAEIEKKGYQLIKKCDLGALLITRSEKGMILLQPDQDPVYLPTEAREVYDVTGAGDTVIAILGASLAAGTTLEVASRLANAAAGVVVGKLGTSTVTRTELEDALRARMHTGFGLMSLSELKKAVARAKAQGEKIVMTNGCFDILHAGHVSYLANARKKGHRLIVAVNSDQSVTKLKGQNRPIVPLLQRMQVLSALEAVDWVVSFDEETPRDLIVTLMPDVLVKGGDYSIDKIAGGKEVVAAGGSVEILDFTEGCSTSSIIDTIKTRLMK